MKCTFDFFDIVEICDAPKTRQVGIAGLTGVVLGKAPDDEPGNGFYGIFVGDIVYHVSGENLRPTSRKVRREDIYDGSTLRVRPDGSLAEYRPRPLEAS